MADPALTPADELRAAAAKLREVADDLGEWRYDERMAWIRDRNGELVCEVADEDDAAWIALMGPDKADALADLLDEAGNLAHFADVMAGGSAEESSLSISERAALRFARAVLGGTA